ncbi:MAG: hypothetical protein WAZ77_04520 [Candidatus Nitrosopolaris sp.]
MEPPQPSPQGNTVVAVAAAPATVAPFRLTSDFWLTCLFRKEDTLKYVFATTKTTSFGLVSIFDQSVE